MSEKIFNHSYEEISFNKECLQDKNQSNYNSLKSDMKEIFDCHLQKQQNIQSLQMKIKEFQIELQKEKRKSNQLQKRNQQLTDMLVSASQSGVKRNEQFIKQVERKICNFKVLNDFNSSSFRLQRNIEIGQSNIRVMTQSDYETSQKYLRKSKENYDSKSKFNSNKENNNTNNWNQKIKLENEVLLKRKSSALSHNYAVSIQKQHIKQRTSCYEAKKGESKQKLSAVYTSGNSTLLNQFAKKGDLRIFEKIESKLKIM